MSSSDQHTSQKNCLNCGFTIPLEAVYCSSCGQKHTDGRVSVRQLFSDFVDNVFNLDSRIVRTLQALFIPGKLTIEYFKGRHKSYYHPIRLFLVLAIICLAILSYMSEGMISTGDIGSTYETRLNRGILLEELDSVSREVIKELDHPIAQTMYDSVLAKFPNKVKLDTINISLLGFSIEKGFYSHTVSILERDVILLTEDTLFKKYEITTFPEKIMSRQLIKIARRAENMAATVIGNIPMMILFMMPFLALFLKLFYVRRKKYFVEHLVFSFHYHSFAFLILPVIMLFIPMEPEERIAIALLIILIYLFIAMKRVYLQGYFKTFVKFIALNIIYLFIMIISFSITAFISFLVF